MACSFSPSLCTAAAKGDTATVEKHLQAQCCNPLATQYFINPHEDSHSPLAIVGFLKRKRSVTVMPKSSADHSTLVKPASPLQVALYYKEEGVLFLLLNHFLKICNGNVARCYDETAEAIATANGYSHLMDFFQYYDCIARDTFGSCWTEAMRHICDLTTKLNKYRKHNAELLQERDEAMKGRDQAVMERDGLARERISNSKGLLEHKDALIQRLQQALSDKEALLSDLQLQLDSLREPYERITGARELDALHKLQWEVKVLEGDTVSLCPVEPSCEDDHQCQRQTPNSSRTSHLDAISPATQQAANQAYSSSVISDCMRHPLDAGTRLAYLQKYLHQCREASESQRAQTASLLEAAKTQCRWNTGVAAIPDLTSDAGLQLGPGELHVFEYGNDVQALEELLHKLAGSLQSSHESSFAEVMRQQAETAHRIRELLASSGITNESSVHVLGLMVSHLEKIFESRGIQQALAETEGRIKAMRSRVEQCASDKENAEQTASVVAVEKEMQRLMDLQRHLLESVKDKLDLLEAKSMELLSLSSTEELCSTALQDVRETIERRKELAVKCEADRAAVQAALVRRGPVAQQLQEEEEVAANIFSKSLTENDAAHAQQWQLLTDALAELQCLQEARSQLVKVRLEQLMNLKRKEREHEIFIWSAEQHAEQLSDVQQKCQVSMDVGQLVADIVGFGCSKIHNWFVESEAELEDLTILAHREMFDSFRDWYLTQGEFTHKKRMLLKDVRRKVAEVENRKQLAIQRLDASAEEHGESLKQLEHQRLELEHSQIPRLEAMAAAALPLFTPTKEYFTRRGMTFTHPDVELQQRNEKREMEIHVREVSKYQELLLASQRSLFEYSSALPDVERAMLLDNHQKIAAGRVVAAEPPKGGALSQLEQNRVLKQRLQECCVLIPLEFLDPITLEIIAEPVIAGDGFTYERSSITHWLQRKGTSPKTGEAMNHTNLVPNTASMDAIQRWKIEQWEFLQQQCLTGKLGDDFCERNDGAEPPAKNHTDSVVEE